MANCTYTFTGADGKSTSIKGIPALKAFLLEGGLDTYLPERAMEMQGPSASRAQPLTPEDVLKPETIAKAEAAIAQYKKAEPPDPLTTKQRADGERLLEPMFEAARRNKDAFDATLDRIGESVNGFAKKPAIKELYRSVTKLVLEKEGFADKMKDLLRGTIVVNSLEDVQNTIDEIGKVYKLTLLKNRLSISVTNGKGETVEGEPLSTGYQDVLTNVALPDGTIAEIQINTPEMAAAKNLGHQIFSFEREMPESPVKSRMVEIQKQIYAEGLAALATRAANSSKTLSNSALSTGSAFSRTSDGLRGLGSGTQAVADRQSGETVTGTSSQSKNMVPGGKDLKSNFIKTSDPIIPDSRAYAKNAAASRVEGTSEDRFKRTPALQQAVVDLQEGKITRDEYNRMVDELRPVYPYKEVPAITTPKDARYALENGRGQSPEKAAQYGVPAMTLKTGDWAQLRLDIPSYQEHDTWVVTVHTPKSTNREVQAAYDAGPRVGYESVAALTDVTFGMNQKAAAKIAAGSSKGTIATMLGKWSPISKADAKARAEAAMKDKSWTQVGMDPFRHSYFYDRDSMRPVLSADEVIQIGPLVLAKNVKFGEDTDITGAEIAFSPRQFPSARGQRFGDSEVVRMGGFERSLLGFYSALARGLQDAPIKLASADAWQMAIKGMVNKGLVKADEVEWSGINDWLAAQPGKVSKDEVAQYLKQGGVKIEETIEDGTSKPVKYQTYTLPGGKNYREVLLTLPEKIDANNAEIYKQLEALDGAMDTDGVAAQRRKLVSKLKKSSDTTYKSSHWDQPNVLAHIRINDRTDADGNKVLFVEELQSDWGQEGKKKGFAGEKKADSRIAEYRELERKLYEDGAATPEEEKRYYDLQEELGENDSFEIVDQAERGVPVAPFVTKTEGWLNLALKRIMVMAAEGGYDKVAFINGDQSADRYDLSKQIGSIDYNKNPYSSGKYYVEARKPDGYVVLQGGFTSDELESQVGKEIANKIVSGEGDTVDRETNRLSGLDLKVGGEGMKVFYDQIVPQAVKKLLPKVGGEKPTSVVFGGEDERGRFVVFDEDSGERLFRTDNRGEAAEYVRVYPGDASIKEVDGLTGEQPGFDVTDAMRDKVAEGLPQFSPRQFRSAQGQRFTLQDETYTKTVQRNLQDYFARVADVQEALSAQGGVVGEAQNVYLAEELSYGRLQEQMVDFKEDMLKPLIKATKAAGLELSDLALYAYAKHAPERNQAIAARNKTFGKGEGSGMTTSEANNIMRAFKADGKDQDLAALHAQLMQITQVTRLVLLSEGLITQDQFDALQRQYADYVPLRGFVEDEDLESGRPVSGPRVGGRGFNIRGKETMRALGRESRAGHIIENIVIDYERAIARSERNTVAKVFLDLATTNPDPGLWEIDTVRTKAAFDRATGMVKYNTLIDKGEDTISAKIDGNEIYIKIKDPLLLRAMRAAGKDETGAIDRVLAMTVGRYTALMRNTLTRYNPAFGFTNAVKDLGFGAVSALSDLGPKGTALFFKNYANPVQSGQMFEEFRAAGATTGGWHIRDQQEMQKELQRLVEWEGGSSIKSTAYSMGKATLDALEFIGQYSETQARFAAYKAARQLNKSPADAASIAKNLTTNFNRKGEWGSAMNTMYLFFNAGVQGSVKTLKNLRSPYVMAAMAGLSGLAAGLAFMGAGVGGDDDDGEAYWDKIPQFEKERNLILMLPPGEGMMVKGESKVGKNGRYFKLPIQYGINVFSTLGYQIADLARYTLDHSRGVSPAKAATNMVSVTFGSFNPFGGGFDPSKPAEVALAVSPSIVDLGVQALMGVNSFGTPVAPRKYDDIKPDAENFGPGMAGTWEQRLARWLSESTGGDRAVGGAIDVSPGSIRNIVRNLTGGTGDFLTSVFVNIPSKMWSPEGEVGPRDVPVLKAFYGEVDEVTDSKLFYERKAEVLEAAKQAANQQKLGIKVEYDDKSKGLQSLSKSAEKYTKKMTELRKKELKTAEDSNLTETQKKSERKDIQKERAQIASEFNALYYEMKKDLSRK